MHLGCQHRLCLPQESHQEGGFQNERCHEACDKRQVTPLFKTSVASPTPTRISDPEREASRDSKSQLRRLAQCRLRSVSSESVPNMVVLVEKTILGGDSGAICVARRDGDNSWGTQAPGAPNGSDIEEGLESAIEVAKRDSHRCQSASWRSRC